MEEYDMIIKTVLFVTIQGLYFAYIVILRPQDSIKENVNDFINEIFYLYYVLFLIYFNTESRWTDTITDSYFWILMANNFILILIVLISITKLVIVSIHKFVCKRKVNPKLKDQTTWNEINETLPNNFERIGSKNKELAKEEIKEEISSRSKDKIFKNMEGQDNKIDITQRMDQKNQNNDLYLQDIEELH